MVPRCAPNYAKLFSRILAASLIMGAAAWAVYGLASRVLGNNMSVLLAICVAMAIYAALIVLPPGHHPGRSVPDAQGPGHRLLHIK